MGHFLVVTVKLSGAKMLLYPTVKRHPWFQCESQPPRNASQSSPIVSQELLGDFTPCVSLPQQRDRDEFVGIVMLAPSAQQASTVLAGGIWGGGTGGASVQILDDFLGGGNSCIFLFSPRSFGEMIQIDEPIFEKGLVQPPTIFWRLHSWSIKMFVSFLWGFSEAPMKSPWFYHGSHQCVWTNHTLTSRERSCSRDSPSCKQMTK